MTSRGLAIPDEIMRGVRAAHLCALQHVAQRHAAMLRRLHPQRHEPSDWPFHARAQAVIADRIEAWRGLRGNRNTAGLAPLLGELLRPGPPGRGAGRAEAVAIGELEHDVGLPAPAFFVEVFLAPGGWRDALALYLSERLRSDATLRGLLLPSGAAEAMTALDRHHAIMLGVEQDLAEYADTLMVLLPELAGWKARVQRTVDEARERLDRVRGLAEMAELALLTPTGGEDPEIDHVLADQADAVAAIADLAAAPDAHPGLEAALRDAANGDLAPSVTVVLADDQALAEPRLRWLGALLFFDDPVGALAAYRQAQAQGTDDPWTHRLVGRLEHENGPRAGTDPTRGRQSAQS